MMHTPELSPAGTPSPAPDEPLSASALHALLQRFRLTRSEVLGYAAERYRRVEGAVAAVLATVPVVEVEDDGEVLLCPLGASAETWDAASREASRAWYRQHVVLSGPFEGGRALTDLVKGLRGDNPLHQDLFAWMQPQRPLPLGHAVQVVVEGHTLTVPALHATRALLEGDGRAYDQFGGNDYLGLRTEVAVRAAAAAAALDHGNGSGGSRMLSGTSPCHTALERTLAEHKGTEAAAVFNTGYQANLAVMSAFARHGTLVFSDALNHASIIDGVHMSGATSIVFRHNDPADLDRRLAQAVAEHGRRALDHALIAVEAIYSMDGDMAPFDELLAVAERYGVPIHVDEAHSALVLGRSGAGICEHFGLERGRVALQMGTLSKAVGGEGGYVAGSATLIEALKLLARPFWFSTALGPASVAGSRAAIGLADSDPARRHRLWANAERVRSTLLDLGYDLSGSTSWIIPVVLGDQRRTAMAQAALNHAGILASAVFAPAVAPGRERIRLSLSSEHTEDQLDRLLQVFSDLRGSAQS